jgi:hypothetical protein
MYCLTTLAARHVSKPRKNLGVGSELRTCPRPASSTIKKPATGNKPVANPQTFILIRRLLTLEKESEVYGYHVKLEAIVVNFVFSPEPAVHAHNKEIIGNIPSPANASNMS